MQERILGEEEHLSRDALVHDLAEREEEEDHVGREEEHQKQVEPEVEREGWARGRQLVHLSKEKMTWSQSLAVMS